MKTVSYIISAVLLIMFTATTVSAQTTGDQTISFKVYGVCDDCKNRIESAAMDGKGVKKAEWDIQSNVLVLVGSSKMTKENVAEKISKAGYKSDITEADPAAYAKLPKCWQYVSDADKH